MLRRSFVSKVPKVNMKCPPELCVLCFSCVIIVKGWVQPSGVVLRAAHGSTTSLARLQVDRFSP